MVDLIIFCVFVGWLAYILVKYGMFHRDHEGRYLLVNCRHWWIVVGRRDQAREEG